MYTPAGKPSHPLNIRGVCWRGRSEPSSSWRGNGSWRRRFRRPGFGFSWSRRGDCCEASHSYRQISMVSGRRNVNYQLRIVLWCEVFWNAVCWTSEHRVQAAGHRQCGNLCQGCWAARPPTVIVLDYVWSSCPPGQLLGLSPTPSPVRPLSVKFLEPGQTFVEEL